MTKRYILLTALTIAAFIRADQAPDNAAEATRAAHAQNYEKSTFYYANTLTTASIHAATGKYISASGYNLLNGTATLTSNPTGGTAITLGGSGGITTGAIRIAADHTILDFDGNALIHNAAGGTATAIQIADDVSSVVIKNGTILATSGANAFGIGIHIGRNVTNVLIQNMVIEGCIGDHSIYIEGSNANECSNITLENVTIVNHNRTTGAANALYIKYTRGLSLNNVTVNDNKTTGSGAFAGIKIENSSGITGENISANHNTSASSTSNGIHLSTCNDINLTNVNVSGAIAIANTNATGIKIESCNNVTVTGLLANNIVLTQYGVWLLTSKNITINNASISNNANTGAITGMLIDNCKAVTLNNSMIANNAPTTDFDGIKCQNATNKSITFNSVNIEGNTAGTNGVLNGANVVATEGISFINCQVRHNTTTDTTTIQNIRGLLVDGSITAVKDLYIDGCRFLNNSAATFAGGGTPTSNKSAAGVYINTVTGCTINNTESNHNTGAGSAFGFYVNATNGLQMTNCRAIGNAAATYTLTGLYMGMMGMDQADASWQVDNGIDALPSAGLYLLASNHAYIADCIFKNNKAGNKTPGGGGASTTLNVKTSCSGHGVANVGTDSSNPNNGNSFVRCLFQGNGTQISSTAPGNNAGATYQIISGNRYHWQSELFEAGASEMLTDGSHYLECSFLRNGTQNTAVGYGLVVISGCLNVSAQSCTAKNNRWYGFFDNTATNSVTTFTSCISDTNGLGNTTYAVAVQSDQDIRNYNISDTSPVPYKSVSRANRSTLDPISNPLLNISITA